MAARHNDGVTIPAVASQGPSCRVKVLLLPIPSDPAAAAAAALWNPAACRVKVIVNPTSREVFNYAMMVVPGNN